jgi:uncharacterized protein YndB with AHSA1/START domain
VGVTLTFARDAELEGSGPRVARQRREATGAPGATKSAHDRKEINVSETSVRLERHFEAPVKQVFRAWSHPQALGSWIWGSLSVNVESAVDFRPGGSFRVSTARPDGGRWAVSGSYVEIVPNQRIIHTLEWDAPMGYESLGEKVSIELEERDGGTTLRFDHEGVSGQEARDEHARGWGNALDALDRYLKAKPTL